MLDLFRSMGFMVFPQTAIAFAVLLLILVNAVRLLRFGNGLPRKQAVQSVDAILFWGGLAAILGLLGTSLGLAKQASAIFSYHTVNPRLVVVGFSQVITTTVFGLLVLSVALVVWYPLRLAAERLVPDDVVSGPAQRLGIVEAPGLRVAYRRLVLWFGCQLLVELVLAVGGGSEGATRTLLSILGLAGELATFVALIYYGFRTARALGSKVAWLWALGMFLPGVNLVTLLTLSWRATRACRELGIPVGLFGPR